MRWLAAILLCAFVVPAVSRADKIPYLPYEESPYYLDYEEVVVQQVNKLLELARQAVRDENWPLAFKLVGELRKIDASNPAYDYVLAQIAYWQHDWSQVFRLTGHSFPDTYGESAAMLRGGALLATGDFKSASDLFRKWLADHPSATNARRGLADALMGVGLYAEAADMYKQVLSENPHAADAERGLKAAETAAAEGDTIKRLRIVREYQEVSERLEALPPIEAATISFLRGDRNKGIEILNEAIEKNPDSKELHNRIGVFYASLGRDDLSRKHIEIASRMAPDDPDVVNNNGVLSMHLGQDDQAVSSFRRAIELRPDYSEAYRNLARINLLRGKSQESIDAAMRSLALDHDSVDARLFAGVGNYRLGNYEQALELLDPCLKAPSRRPAIWFLAAVCAHRLDRRDVAARYYREGLKYKDDNVLALNNLADLILNNPESNAKDLDEALGLAQKASGLTNHGNATVELTLRQVREAIALHAEAEK